MLCKKLFIIQESALQHLISCMLGFLHKDRGMPQFADGCCSISFTIFPQKYFWGSSSFLRA